MLNSFLQSLATNQIVQALVIYLLYDLACKIAPHFGKLIKFLAKKILETWDKFCIYLDVKKAEKKFPAAQMGEQKKNFVLQKNQKREQRLQKIDSSVDAQIEIFVSSMNSKKLTMKDTIKSEATDLANTTAESIKESVSEAVQTKITETLTK